MKSEKKGGADWKNFYHQGHFSSSAVETRAPRSRQAAAAGQMLS